MHPQKKLHSDDKTNTQSEKTLKKKEKNKREKKTQFKKASSGNVKKYIDTDTALQVSQINTVDAKVSSQEEAPKNLNSDKNIKNAEPWTQMEPPNGGWGWIVCFSSFFINIIIIGMHNSFSILTLDIREAFDQRLPDTVLIGSFAFGSILLFAPLSGFLANIFGCRMVALVGVLIASAGLLMSSFAQSVQTLYFTYGLMYGFGTSLCYMQGTVMVTRYFTTHRSLASGMALSGSTLGAMIMAPVYNKLRQLLGWRKALRIISGLTFMTLLNAATYKPLQSPGASSSAERIKTSTARKFVLDFSLWKNKAFLIWAVAVALCKFGYLVPWVYMGTLTKEANLDRNYGSTLIQYMGITATVSRLIIGKIADLPMVNRQYVSQISSCGMGLVNIVQSYTSSDIINNIKAFHITNSTIYDSNHATNSTMYDSEYDTNSVMHEYKIKASLTAYAVTLGFMDGGVEILLPIMTLDLVGAERLSMAWGCILAVISLSTLGPPVAGVIQEKTNSFFWPFWITGAPMILSAIVLFLIPWARRQPQVIATSILSINPEHLEIMEEQAKESQIPESVRFWMLKKFNKKYAKSKEKEEIACSQDNLLGSSTSLEPYNKPVPLPGI